MHRWLTITVGDEDRSALTTRMVATVETGTYQGEFINYSTPALLFTRLTDSRWKLLQALIGAPVTGVRELSRRIGRDVKRVHEDAAILADLGLIERTEGGKLLCPFSEIHLDIWLKKTV